MNPIRFTKTLIAGTAWLAVLLPLHVHAAGVSFDFTAGGSASSLTDSGNVFRFQGPGVGLEVRAFTRSSKGEIDAATVVQSSADYAASGFKTARGLDGLGICGDSDGKLKNCLTNAGKFSAGTKDLDEWFLLIFDTPVQLSSFTVNLTANAAGRVDYFLGQVDPYTLSTANYHKYFGERMSFGYDHKAGNQTFELARLQTHNAVLIGGDAGATRFMLTDARATVVPLPPAALLLISGLLALAGLRRTQLR